MDDLDRNLVGALRRDGRAAVSTLADRLGVTRATVRARMERLHARGEIVGFTAVLKRDAEDHPVRGVVMIEIDGKGSDHVVARLEGLPNVHAIHTTHGRWDLVAEFGAETLDELDRVLRDIRLIDGVSRSETNLYLATRRALGPKRAV